MPCGSRRRPSYPAFTPPVPPALGLARRVLPTGTVVWSVPHPLSTASPSCRFVLGGGGGCPALPTFIPHPSGGGAMWGGLGNLVVTPSLHECRRHDASTAQPRGAAPVPLLGGGHALWLPSSSFLPCVRTPGGPPAGAGTARALYGHIRCVDATISWVVLQARYLPTLPGCSAGLLKTWVKQEAFWHDGQYVSWHAPHSGECSATPAPWDADFDILSDM